MVISDHEAAQSVLQRIGYYRLSGYWYPFRSSRPSVDGGVLVEDTFRANTALETIVDLYVFDKKLRLLFLDALERIEIALRVQLTLLLGRYGAKAHRDPAVFEGFFSRRQNPKTFVVPHQDWLARTDDAFDRSKEEFVKHFKSKYSGEYPPVWIACEIWDFGAMSTLFGGMKKTDQSQIAAIYGLHGLKKFQMIESWVRAMNVARNACAHHSRLWNRPLPITPMWPAAVEIPLLSHLVGNAKAQNRAYGIALLIRHMLQAINPNTSWGVRLRDLCASFPKTPHLSLTSAGFTPNWEEEVIWNQ